ncbi:MAG: alpha-mannosidase, partial [Elusimicrobia bacterium]|nr:alpha-mannosidase [Elusimicrobiota bacterium]
EKEKSYLSFKSGRLILSAVKKSERNESIIIRVFNPAKKTISETLTLFKNVKKAKLVNLNEEPIRNLAVSGKKIRFRIKSRQILTIEAFIK